MRINFTSPANPLSYGVVGINILKSLVRRGHEVAFFPILFGTECDLSDQDREMVHECIDRQSRFDPSAPSIRVFHQHNLAKHVGKGPHCGFPIFELDCLTEREAHHIRCQDLVFVCSHWAQSIIKQYDKDSVVIPLGVDANLFRPNNLESWDSTRFVNIGKWEVRKGHDVLVEAFNRAFEPSDDVELWMMNHNPFLSKEEENEWRHLYKSSKMGNRIFFLEKVDSHKEVADIMNRTDCGVFPSRAEGWNLEALEMMACGKEVIITGCTGHTEFCNIKNSKLIHISEQEEAFDGVWFVGQGNWSHLGEEQIDQCVEHMREVHKNKKFNKQGVKTAQKFSWDNSASKIIEAIS